MSTFLQLVQGLRRETGYADSGPATVVAQTGYDERAVEWIKNSWIEIQNSAYWRWLRKEFTLTTTASDDSYAYTDCIDVPTAAAITRFGEWLVKDGYNPPKCYLQSSGSGTEYWLTYIDWPSFRTIYQIGNQTEGAPAHITIDPDNNLVIGPTPNDAYVITSEYQRSAQVLAADSDEPEMPSDYHMMIVYTAMEDGGYYEAGEEILARAIKKKRRLRRQLRRNQGPKMRVAGPLA